MSKETLFLTVLAMTLTVHLGKFLDWLLGPKQERLKRDALTEVYTFIELGGMISVVRYSIALLVQFLDTFLSTTILSGRWLARVTTYSLSLNMIFGIIAARALLPTELQRLFYLLPSLDLSDLVGPAGTWAFSLQLATATSVSLLVFDCVSLAILHLLLKHIQSRDAYGTCGYLFLFVIVEAGIVLTVPAIAFACFTYLVLHHLLSFAFLWPLTEAAFHGTICGPLEWLTVNLKIVDLFGCLQFDTNIHTVNGQLADATYPGLAWYNIFMMYAIPPLMPGAMLFAMLFVTVLLRSTRNIIRRPLTFIIERLQGSPTGLFTQLSTVAAAILAVLQLFKSQS